MNFLRLLALALPCTVLAVLQNHIDDTSPLVDYYQGLHCSPCPDEFKNYGLDPAQLSNGTFSAFENNGGNFFILDSVPDAGGDFSMNGPPVVNQYNVLAYAKTDIPDGSHILNMDVGDTPVVFDYAYYTSNNLEPDSPAPSAASNSDRCYFFSRDIQCSKTLSIPLIAGAAAVGVALILALFVGFMLYHRARRTKADAPGMEDWGSVLFS
ncbi:hypothetical protein B0H14DRAFT_3634461 [Mycena olivaceomarginata]|nr:hypothetical protein B0H14DRAFT_3634461 [Mycena olivaceomarginata]